MGIIRRLLGLENKKADKPYLDAGVALTHRLASTLGLTDWKDLLPTYTEEEIEAINRKQVGFQKMANQVAGAEVRFHSEILPEIQRTLVGGALTDLAGSAWKFSRELPTNWRQCVSTYLKAWSAQLNPLTLLDLGDLLVKAGYPTEAKAVFQTLLLFPTYANTYYGGKEQSDLVQSITESAMERLSKLP